MKSPKVAAFLSLVVPGAGQLYNEQMGKGIFIMFTWWLIIPWIWGIFDAHATAKKITEGAATAQTEPGRAIAVIAGGFLLIILIAIMGLVAAIAIPNLVAARQAAIVESGR